MDTKELVEYLITEVVEAKVEAERCYAQRALLSQDLAALRVKHAKLELAHEALKAGS